MVTRSLRVVPSVVLLLGLLLGSAIADTISGRVVGVADGDTLTVLDASKQQHKIRLDGIDAPEKAQPFGQRSKQ
jgi:endonuclease YncB( thermonuclease family)